MEYKVGIGYAVKISKKIGKLFLAEQRKYTLPESCEIKTSEYLENLKEMQERISSLERKL